MKVLVGKRTGFVPILAPLGIAAALTAALPASAVQPPAAADPAVITDWNTISANTIAGPAPNGAGLNNAEGIMWFSFAQAAVYNAVEGITGDYALYDWHAKAPKGASPEAAAPRLRRISMRRWQTRSPVFRTACPSTRACGMGPVRPSG